METSPVLPVPTHPFFNGLIITDIIFPDDLVPSEFVSTHPIPVGNKELGGIDCFLDTLD